MYWPTILSVIGYMAAITTIDVGGTGIYHMIGAAYFFIILEFMVMNYTVISYKMRKWDVRFMSKNSLIKKITVAVYLNLVYLYCFVRII
jgi:hypothetical protein